MARLTLQVLPGKKWGKNYGKIKVFWTKTKKDNHFVLFAENTSSQNPEIAVEQIFWGCSTWDKVLPSLLVERQECQPQICVSGFFWGRKA